MTAPHPARPAPQLAPSTSPPGSGNRSSSANSDGMGGVVLVSDQQVGEPPPGVTVPPELLEAVARAVAAVLVPQRPQPAADAPEPAADFLNARQFARRLGISHETVRRLAIAGELPCTVVCRGARKTTRRYPRRFADEFAASGLDAADLAEFTVRWRARVTGGGQ